MKTRNKFLLGLSAFLLGGTILFVAPTDVHANFTRSVAAECANTNCTSLRSVASITPSAGNCDALWIGASMRRHDGTRTSITSASGACSRVTARSAALSHFDNNGTFWTLEAWWH